MTRRFFCRAMALMAVLSFLGTDFPSFRYKPVYARAQYPVVLTLMQERRYSEALAECQRLIETAPPSANAYQRLAEIANEAGPVTEVAAFLKRLPADTTDQQALKHYGLTALYALKPKPNEAERQLIAENGQLALSFNPNLTKAYQHMADARIALGQEAELERYLETLRAKAPQNALTHLWLGYFHKQTSRHEASIAALDKALALDPNLLEALYEKINVLVRIKGKSEQSALQTALTLGQQLLRQATDQGNIELQIKAQRMIGYAHSGLKDRMSALNHFRAGLQLAQSAGELILQDALLANLCDHYTELDDYASALSACRQGLTFSISRYAEWNFGNLGFAFRRLGDTRTGIAYYKKSLEVAIQKNSIDCKNWMLTNLGEAYADLKEYDESQKLLNEALELSKQQKNPVRESSALASLGKLYFEKNEYDEARKFQLKAYKLACDEHSEEQEARSLVSLGAVYFSLNDWQHSLESYQAARILGEKLNSARTAWLARSGMAANYRQLGNFSEAEAQYRLAIDAVEKTRSKLKEESDKVSFWQDKVKIYKDLISLLMRPTRNNLVSHKPLPSAQSAAIDAQVFRLAEQWRARAFLDLLSEAGTRSEAGNPITALRQPLELSAAQRLLDAETVVLSYSLDHKVSLLFGVTRNKFEVYKLPGENDINVCTNNLLSLLTDKTKGSPQGYQREARALYEKLIEPASALLAGKKHLIIVPDGTLQRLPFAVLLKEPAKKNGPVDLIDLPYLIKDFAISYAPSVSIWARLHESVPKYVKAPKDFVAFGNPAYPEKAQGLFASLLGRANPQPLRYSQSEMERIGALFGKNGSVAIYQGAQANENTVKSAGEINQYRFVHFSVHGGINEAFPRLSGLLLSLPTGSKEESGSLNVGDGVLTAEEIMSLHLNAELVSLSACETGLGKLVNGEGLMGLMRAFIYAGTPSVAVSLWNVDDRATADLMEGFYRHLLQDRKQKGRDPLNLNKAEAMREAQLDAIREGSAPYYWASFVIEGHP